MKKITVLLIIVVIMPLFGLNASAEERTDEYISEFFDIVPEDYKDALSDDGTLIDAIGIKALLSEITDTALGRRGEIVSFFLTLLCALSLSALASITDERMRGASTTALGIIFSVIIYERIGTLFSGAMDSLSEIRDFFSAFLPISIGITTLGGNTLTAGVQGGGMYLALSVLDGIGGRLFTVLLGFGLSASLISAFGAERVASVSRGIKNVFSFVLGIFTAILSGTVALQTMIASASDSTSMRAAKYLASGMIPVVGSTVSGALSNLAAGIGYAKSVVGVGAVAVIILLALSPLTVFLLYRLAMSLALIFSDFVGATALSSVLGAFRSSLDSLIAFYSLSMVIYIFQIILFIKSGVALS